MLALGKLWFFRYALDQVGLSVHIRSDISLGLEIDSAWD